MSEIYAKIYATIYAEKGWLNRSGPFRGHILSMEVRPQNLRAHVTASIAPLFRPLLNWVSGIGSWIPWVLRTNKAKPRQRKKTKNNARQYHNAASKAARRQGLKSSFATPDWLDQRPRGDNLVESCVHVCLCVWVVSVCLCARCMLGI